MYSIAHKQVQGVFVYQNNDNGYVNATHLSKLYFKMSGVRREPHDWLRLESTKRGINHLATVTGCPATELVIVKQGGLHGDETVEQGTWLHPRLSTRYSIWLSEEFGYAVECLMEEWAISKQIQPVAPQAKLPARYEAKETAEAINYISETVALNNPRLAQMLIDHAMRDIQVNQAVLAPADDRLMGVVEIALDMGYPMPKSDSALGRKVAKAYRDAGLGEPQTDKRECGGAFREMKVYPGNEPIVREAIKSYYGD